jgi:hypothetical protein
MPEVRPAVSLYGAELPAPPWGTVPVGLGHRWRKRSAFMGYYTAVWRECRRCGVKDYQHGGASCVGSLAIPCEGSTGNGAEVIASNPEADTPPRPAPG